MIEKDMGGALEHWLGFQDKIGRSFMMNEDAMKYPLSDNLVNALGLNLDAIDLEKELCEKKSTRLYWKRDLKTLPSKTYIRNLYFHFMALSENIEGDC